jgi:hypothetical protein
MKLVIHVPEGQTPAAQTEAANVSTFMEFSQKMLENLFNFASSFAVSASDMRQRPGKGKRCVLQYFCPNMFFNSLRKVVPVSTSNASTGS